MFTTERDSESDPSLLPAHSNAHLNMKTSRRLRLKAISSLPSTSPPPAQWHQTRALTYLFASVLTYFVTSSPGAGAQPGRA